MALLKEAIAANCIPHVAQAINRHRSAEDDDYFLSSSCHPCDTVKGAINLDESWNIIMIFSRQNY